MDHSELIAELPIIEKLTPAERIQIARQRRALQLLKCRDREKAELQMAPLIEQRNRRVRFGTNIALLEATARNDVDEVRRLLEGGANPNLHNEDGLTALHQCAIDNNDDLTMLLIAHGADVNSRDTELWTPLHAAGCCGHTKIVRHLIENGAELLAVNADGNMPYDICEDEPTLDYIESEMAKKGITQEDIDEERLATERQMLTDVEWLHKNGQSLDFRDEHGATLLHIACANGFYLVVHFLLEVGSSVHARDNDGWQPVHAAACWAQPDSLELLVNYGADINARTPAGETPFDLCEDDTVRAVIMTLQVEQRRRLLSFARDSRRMSRRKKPSSKFESPDQKVSESHLSASRGAIRRHSLRDRAGVTLARLEARKEAALLRSWSFEESSPNAPPAPADTTKDENGGGTDNETGPTSAGASTSSVVLVTHGESDEDHRESPPARPPANQRPNGDVKNNPIPPQTSTADPNAFRGVSDGSVTSTSSMSTAGQHISTSQWLQKIQEEQRGGNQQIIQSGGPEVPARRRGGGSSDGSHREKKSSRSTSSDKAFSSTSQSERAIDVSAPFNGDPASTKPPVEDGELSKQPLTLSDLKRIRAEERTKPNAASKLTPTPTSQYNSIQVGGATNANSAPFRNETAKNNGNAAPSSKFANVSSSTVDGPTARYRAPSDTVLGSSSLSNRGKLGGLKCCTII